MKPAPQSQTVETQASEASATPIEELPVAGPLQQHALPSGRTIEITPSEDGERLRVVGRSGRVELTVVLTDAGPRLVFDAADVEIRAQKSVTVDCERFSVNARVEATVRAEQVTVEATRGDIALRANDAVAIDGEEVRMNCDRPDVIPPWMRETLQARFAREAEAAPAARDVQGDPSLLDEFDKLAR